MFIPLFFYNVLSHYIEGTICTIQNALYAGGSSNLNQDPTHALNDARTRRTVLHRRRAV